MISLEAYEKLNHVLSYGIPTGIIVAGTLYPDFLDASNEVTMSFREFGVWYLSMAMLSEAYIHFQEWVYFTFPSIRIQKVEESKTTREYWATAAGTGDPSLGWTKCHYELTTILMLAANHTACYYLLPGYFPGKNAPIQTWFQRLPAFILQMYVLSFLMYWMHRAMHEIPFLWTRVHAFHHLWKTPISRITYLDHPFEAWCLTQTGPGYVPAQLLFPLDRTGFYLLSAFRILESMEKHSGHESWMNLTYTLQKWFPYAAQPRHHDYHHEFIRGNDRFKGCNYTFTAVGGLWDVVFGTRKEAFRRAAKAKAT